VAVLAGAEHVVAVDAVVAGILRGEVREGGGLDGEEAEAGGLAEFPELDTAAVLLGDAVDVAMGGDNAVAVGAPGVAGGPVGVGQGVAGGGGAEIEPGVGPGNAFAGDGDTVVVGGEGAHAAGRPNLLELVALSVVGFSGGRGEFEPGVGGLLFGGDFGVGGDEDLVGFFDGGDVPERVAGGLGIDQFGDDDLIDLAGVGDIGDGVVEGEGAEGMVWFAEDGGREGEEAGILRGVAHAGGEVGEGGLGVASPVAAFGLVPGGVGGFPEEIGGAFEVDFGFVFRGFGAVLILSGGDGGGLGAALIDDRFLAFEVGEDAGPDRGDGEEAEGGGDLAEGFGALAFLLELVGLVALGEGAEGDAEDAGDDLEAGQFALLPVGIDDRIDLGLGDGLVDGLAEGFGGGPALCAVGEAEVGGDGFGALAAVEVALGIDHELQGVGKAFAGGVEAGLLFALVPGRVRLAFDHVGEDAVGAAELLEVGDLVGDVGGLDGLGGAEDEEEEGAVESAVNGGAEVGVGGEFLLVAEDGEDALGDELAALVGGAYEVFGDLVGFDLLVEPGGPLAAGLLVVGVAIADEAPIRRGGAGCGRRRSGHAERRSGRPGRNR